MAACGGKGESSEHETSYTTAIKVFVSIPPQAYFVKRVGGTMVQVEVLIDPGASPVTYQPTPHQIVALSSADVYFTIGVPFESSVVSKIKAASSGIRIVDTGEGIIRIPIERQYLPGKTTLTESSTSSGGLMDPHIWLDPQRVKVQARNICNTLSELASSNGMKFEENLKAFEADLDSIDQQIEGALMPMQGAEFYVYHSVFGYYAERYGLKQIAIEVGGKELGAKELTELIDRAKSIGVTMIFVQPQFSSTTAEAAAKSIGCALVKVDPLRRDYLTNMMEMTANITAGLVLPATSGF